MVGQDSNRSPVTIRKLLAKGENADPIELVREALSDVLDPELGMDIVSLGLVYDITRFNNQITVDMTLTTPGCPVAESLPRSAQEEASKSVPGLDVVVRVVWDPPWDPSMINRPDYGR